MLGNVLQALSGKGIDHLDKLKKKKKVSRCLTVSYVWCYCTALGTSIVCLSIFRANVPTLSSPTKSFYMTNLQVELSW